MRDNSLYQKTPFEHWIGIVCDRDDPLQLGRVRVRILGYHTDSKTETPDSDLPWCYPIQSVTSAANSGVGSTPLGVTLGTWVVGYFLDGRDQQIPVFTGTFGSFQKRSGTSSQVRSDEKVLTTEEINGKANDGSILTDTGGDPVNTANIKSPDGWKLGQTSEKYESGGKGPGTINNYANLNDPGGASYGAFQFASFLPKVMPNGKSRSDSRNTQFVSYLKQSKFGDSFIGLTPATKEFDAKWKKVASDNGDAFFKDQYQYIKDNFYLVMLSKLKQHGLDLTGFGAGVQDLIWSTSVQLGPNRLSIFLDSLSGMVQLTDTKIVTIVSDFKINNVAKFFSSSSSAIQTSVKNRFISEKTALLKLCNGDVVPASPSEKETTYGGTYNSNKDTENKNILSKTIVGFTDPSGEYPREDYDNQQDTNKLARNVINATAAQYKSDLRAYGLPLPNGDSFDQPSNPYAAQYPYNKVTETESGHVFEVDDTPGSERINQWHTSGTFSEVDSEGNQVNRIMGSGYTIIDRNGFISITGQANVSIIGSINLFIGADANIEVNGNTFLSAKNDVVVEAEGSVHLSSADEISIHAAKSLYLEAGENIYMRANGSVITETDKDVTTLAHGSITSSADINHSTNGNTATFVSSGGKLDMKAIGDINLDGTNIYENSNRASKGSVADKSKYSYAGIPSEGRYTGTEVLLDEYVAQGRTDSEDYLVEAPHDEYDLAKAQADLIATGGATKEDLGDVPYVAEEVPVEGTDNVVTEGSTSTADTEYLKTLTSVPDNYRLSANFTLADLSTKALVTPTKVVAQYGLKVGEIVANLQLLAIYVLEPLKKKFPQMQITSGFRTYSPGSQHTSGQAVDLQWGASATNADTYQITKEIEKLVPFDQLLHECKNYGSSRSWTHLSYAGNKNRKSSLTFFNNKLYAQGIVKVSA